MNGSRCTGRGIRGARMVRQWQEVSARAIQPHRVATHRLHTRVLDQLSRSQWGVVAVDGWLTATPAISLLAERDDRINVGRPSCREVARQQRYCGEQECDCAEGRRIGDADPVDKG